MIPTSLSPEEEIRQIVARIPRAPQPGAPPPAPDATAAAASPVIAPPTPKVTPVQVPQQRQTDQAELDRLKNTGAGVEQLQHKHPILGTIARIGDAALSSLFPSVAANIPGTELHHTQLVNRAQGRVANDLAGEQKEAQTANEAATTEHTQTQTAAIPAHTKLEEAQADALANKPDKPQTIEQQYSDAVADALHRGVKPAEDPTVQQLADAITSLKNQPAAKEQNRDDRAIGIMAKPKEQWTPEEVAYMRGYDQYVQKTKVNPGVQRAEIFLQGKQLPAIDTENNNALTFANPNQINSSPGRFLPQAGGAQALGKTALIEDIRGNVQQVRDSLKSMPEFDTPTKAKIALALRSRDPKGSISALISSGAAGSLNPQQQDYLINTALLIENAMAMRSVLGAGQGSEDLRSAITATIPGPTTPTKEYGLKQLDQFEKVLDRLEKGIPKVPLAQGGNSGGGNEVEYVRGTDGKLHPKQ